MRVFCLFCVVVICFVCRPVFAASAELVALYKQNPASFFWFEGDNLAASKIKNLFALIGELKRQGFSSDYNGDLLHQQISNLPARADDSQKNQLDYLLSETYLKICHDVLWGQVDPKKALSDWDLRKSREDFVALALAGLKSEDVAGPVLNQLPGDAAYVGLVKSIVVMDKFIKKGGWPKVPQAGKKWEPGERGPHIAALRARLRVTGELKSAKLGDEELYDDELVAAVKLFQKSRGLNDDGVVGVYTLELINMSATDIKKQILVNLERLRWLPREIESTRVFVNIPDFTMSYFENNQAVVSMRVVAGLTKLRTMVFKDELEYIVFNPRWEVPAKIARKEMLPDIQKDPDYIKKKNFKVYQNIDGERVLVDAGMIDWATISADDVHFSQDSGAGNSLGRMKFIFPNKYDIYMHDTPSKGLFKNDIRAYSHGCIRLAKPMDLALVLLKDFEKPKYDQQAIEAIIAAARERVVALPKKIPVYIYYLTAWVDANAHLQLRKDIYEHDKKMIKEMRL